jgi:hypothetical protein
MTGPSKFYIDALERSKRHQLKCKNSFTGRFLFRYAEHLKQVVDEHGCKTLLDWGCGKGDQWRNVDFLGQHLAEYLQVEPTLHDPAWPKYEEVPTGTFDVVVCTQVMNYIPVADHKWFIERLLVYADKALFFGQREGAPRKKLHRDMASKMPGEWFEEDWIKALTVEGSRVPIYLSTHKADDTFTLRRLT